MTRPTSKREIERGTDSFARGGKGGASKMLAEVPAEVAPRGRTGPTQAKAPGSKRAIGGRSRDEGWGVALPAVGGCCGPSRG
jgi:hypothetical protein